jgi:hypothetical protein
MLVVGIVLDIQKKFGWLSVLKKFLVVIGKGLKVFYKIIKACLRFIKALLFD